MNSVCASGYVGNFNWIRLVGSPGIVQAEDYDKGGEGVAYHDLTAGNDGGAYRTSGRACKEKTWRHRA